MTEGRLLRWTLAALNQINDLDVVLAVTARDRGDVGPVTGNVQILQDVPLSTFLDQCDVLVHHGGDGTGMTGLCAGVPQVVIPQFSFQDLYGRLVEQQGAGRSLPGLAQQQNPEVIAEAIRAVLEEPGYRVRAKALQAEIESMPAPATLIPELERLAAVAAS